MSLPFVRSLLLAVASALVLAAGCSEKKTPEEVIKASLDDAAEALAEARIGDAADLLADDYKDARGRDKRSMKGLALLATRGGKVTINRTDETITVNGDTATVKAKVWAVQTARDAKVVADLIPQGRAVEVEITLKKMGDEWRVTAIDGDDYGG